MPRSSITLPFLRRAVVLVVGLVAGACAPDRHPTAADEAGTLLSGEAVRPQRSPARQVQTTTPRYPAPVLYILYREYVAKHPKVKLLRPDDRHYQQYVERRLRQLYPDKGYDGMLADAVAEVERSRKQTNAYGSTQGLYAPVDEVICSPYDATCSGSRQTGETPSDPDALIDASWSGVDEHPAPPEGYIPTLQEEVDTLVAEPAEVERLYYYESLATDEYRAPVDEVIVTPYSAGSQPKTTDDFIRLAGQGWTPGDGSLRRTQGLGAALVALPVVAGLAGYFYWRIDTAGNRAEQRAIQFYPGMGQADTRADAFRHIFVNVQLRRYCTGWVAKLIMDQHEQNGNNTDGARVMDLHNNDVGRDVRYKHFRGHWFWDHWDWKEWATRVRS